MTKQKKLDKNGKEFFNFPVSSGLYQNDYGQVYMKLPNGKEYELSGWRYVANGNAGTEKDCFLDEAKDALQIFKDMKNAIEVDLNKTITLTEDLEGPDFFVKKGKCKLLKVFYSRDYDITPLAVLIQDSKGNIRKVMGTYFQELSCWNKDLGLV